MQIDITKLNENQLDEALTLAKRRSSVSASIAAMAADLAAIDAALAAVCQPIDLVPTDAPPKVGKRKPRPAKAQSAPRPRRKVAEESLAAIRQCLHDATAPYSTAEVADATGLHAPVILAAMAELGATKHGDKRTTRWSL